MKRRALVLAPMFSLALLAGVTRLAQAAEFAADPQAVVRDQPSAQAAAELIAQLGSDQFIVRRRAEAMLIEMGAAAFDELQMAERDPDLEIATRASYILQQIRIEWVRPDDPPEVRRLMQRYGQFSKLERSERIEQLGSLSGGLGIRALCRIARFDPAPLLARQAALQVLTSDDSISSADRVGAIQVEVGDSDNPACDWLRTYVEQLGDPRVVNPRWNEILEDEIALLEAENSDTDLRVTQQLLAYHLQLCHAAQDPQAVFASLQQRIALSQRVEDNLTAGLAHAMTWILDKQAWETLNLLEDQYGDAIREHRLPLYLTAAARDKQGRQQDSEQLAQQALDLVDDDDDMRNDIAEVVGDLGRHDWAEREWRYVIATYEPTHLESMIARRALASWRMHDRGDDKAAADLLAEVCDSVEGDPAVRRRINEDQIDRYYLNLIYQQRDFFLACHYGAEGDVDKQKQYLEKAFKRDTTDADVLIAMYQVGDDDETYRKTTLKRISRASKIVESSIKQDPNNPNWYNHWAWLTSNTEGDFQRAVRYSQKSLELRPDTASYLDTLGRCHYAAGDLQNAIKVQRQAVELHPQMAVMQKQLQLFEDEVAAGEPASQHDQSL